MCSKQREKVPDTFSDVDNSLEEEIERLKRDIKKTEKKIFSSQQSRFSDNAKFIEECDKSDNDSLKSSNYMNFYSSPIIEKEIAGRKVSLTSFDSPKPVARDLINISTEKISKSCKANWVSPAVSKRCQTKDDIFPDPIFTRLESSFDCGSSVISLDFGLVSPNKNWCSPPQRIERAQNREWSSPHRVIDRPNPENSPGNWISMKESCLTLGHSPALGLKIQAEIPCIPIPDPQNRPISQNTYIVPETNRSQESQPTRKTSVLGDYEPERVVSTKKRSGGPPDPVETNFLPTNDKVRRIVDSDGHVIKISLLEDFEAPAFGKTHEKAEATDKETRKPTEKIARGATSKFIKISSKLSPPESKPQAKKKKEEGGARVEATDTEKIEEDKTNKIDEDDKENIRDSTQKVIQDLEEILGKSNKEPDKATTSPIKEKCKDEKTKLKKPKPVEEQPPETPEKRKRNIDPKAVQDYIKNQKQKRMEQVKTEKKTKIAEREARKKKLEELRVKTLKLAAQSKRKKTPDSNIKNIVEPATEDDITMSLGLKQTKPKVSYNESVSKLKKKPQKPRVESPHEEEAIEQDQKAFEGVEDKLEEEINLKNLEEDLNLKKPEEDLNLKKLEEDLNLKKPEEDLNLKKPENTVQLKPGNNLNETLKKLAEVLHTKLEKEKQVRSRPGSVKSAMESLSQIPSQETIQTFKSVPEENRQLITVDLETIQSLKTDIKKISENFKVLHEMIVDKTELKAEPKPELSEKDSIKKQPSKSKSLELKKEIKEIPDWLKALPPRVYPYNVFTAFQQKMNLKHTKTSSTASQGSSTFAEPISNKYDSEFEALSMPSDRLRTIKDCRKSTSEENYYSMKDDSGSELSSSILDSEKQSLTSFDTNHRHFHHRSLSKTSRSSSIVTEITSRSVQLATSEDIDSGNLKSYYSKPNSDRQNMILVTPDIKLISNDLHQEKLNNCTKNLNILQNSKPEELNNSTREQKSDSTISELIDNLNENDRSVKSIKSVNENNVVQRVEEVRVRRSFFQPEMLHLQFQAELTLLETFQQSLSHFLEAERMKTLSEVNKIVFEKAINTEKEVMKEDQAVQTSYIKESSEKTTSEETDSVKTEINVEEESVKSKIASEVSDKLSSSSKEKSEKETQLETDYSNGHTGISFEMLNRMMKDEELRSEHQLALIRLREKTLNEKIKAELTFLEMKKRALKEKGGDQEQSVSAIKKKQRGILLKYQSEKEEIERLKKMHKIASEERKIMLKQQRQIQKMQISTNDMIIKLKRREKSPQKKTPLKPKALKSPDSQSEIPEEIPTVSDSILTESAEESKYSSRTDLALSSRSNISEDDDEIPRRKTLQVSYSLENFKSKKSQLEVEKYPRKRHSVEELLSWTKRLEEKENHLKELEKQTINKVKNKLTKSLKMKDRSTSPFQFPDSIKTVSEVSPSEGTELKKTSTVETVESVPKTESVVEKIQSSASEDIPEQFSKKISTSRTTEYYSESFESPSSSETPKNKQEVVRLKSASSDWGPKAIPIKMSLSPRMQSPRRRYSSGSDDSVNMSHTETASEQSDLETRIAALHEQLRKRKLEAERLRREQKKAQRERLKVKEQSLIKQIQAYDAYIQKKKQELEQEYEHSNQIVMKPLIKQPKVAEKSTFKRQEPVIINESDKFQLRFGSINKEKTLDKESDSEIAEQIKETPSESVKEIIDKSDSVKEVIDKSDSVKEVIDRSDSVKEVIDKSDSVKEVIDKSDSVKEVIEKSESVNEMVEKSESVSEVIEESYSVKEQLESKSEEEKTKTDVEISTKQSLAIKSTTLSEELEGSQSESEDQSLSIKTTLHSPEKQDTDILETPTGMGEEESPERQTLDEDVYESDSFESEAENKLTTGSEKISKSSETSEIEIKTETDVKSKEEEEEEDEEKVKGKSEKADKIADSILTGLILESLNIFCGKKAEAEKKLAEESKLTLETLSSFLAKEIITEAVDDMLKIYNRRIDVKTTPEQITPEVKKRIAEIMSQKSGTRDQRRPQDMMITTYDVEMPPGEREEGEDEEEKAREKRKEGEQTFSEGEGNNQETKADTFTQEWIDDDFGLSRTRREAEELRLQQLQIEQEIQQLQAQQEVPFFYLREIPNKPPPPYTPPGKPLSEIPTSEPEIMAITLNAVRILTDEMKKGKEVGKVEPPWDYFGDAISEHFKCYKFFLFDLAKHIISDLIEQQERKTEVLPWMRTRENLSKFKYQKIERTFECLSDFVQKQVLILFGFGRKVSKESLIVRWIKKKRDHVDEILVGESQEEEAQWTQYDEDQVTVKNEVTLAILDALLEDTARVFNTIFSNKMKKEKGK